MIVGAACAAAAAGLCCGVGSVLLKKQVSKKTAHISDGEQRRALCPIDKPIGNSAAETLQAPDVQVTREFHKLKDQKRQIFVQKILPKGRRPSRILVFVHGFSSHSDFFLEFGAHFARQGAAVVLFDAPSHGRSDGLHTHVEDWWRFIGDIWYLLDSVIPDTERPFLGPSKQPLPVFGMGFSMGGGIVCCLAFQRPDFFRGIIPIAPMLLVSEGVGPGPAVSSILKHVLVPLMPTWPITPSKNLSDVAFRVPYQGHLFENANPVSLCGAKPRLSTAYQLAFVWPEWVKAHKEEFTTPLFILHGAADKITDPAMSQMMFDSSRSSDKRLELIEGACHCELTCCLPGHAAMLGVEWSPEQLAATARVIELANSWMIERSSA